MIDGSVFIVLGATIGDYSFSRSVAGFFLEGTGFLNVRVDSRS